MHTDKLFTSSSDAANLNSTKDIVENCLEKELKQIDEMYENDLDHFNLIERENVEVLQNISKKFQSGIMQNENLAEILNNKEFLSVNPIKIEVVLDNKIILDSIASNPYIEKDLINSNNLTDEERANILICSNVFYLNDKKITKIANLEIYPNLAELYLQRNFIKKIEGLECLKNLKILSLNNNYIGKVEGLTHLTSLKILDLGDNIIEELCINEFPLSISYLYLFDNILYDTISLFKYRAMCIKHFPELIRLDGLNLTDLERMILTEEDVHDSDMNIVLIRKLNYVKDHYNKMKRTRRDILKGFSNTGNLLSIDNDSSIFVTNELDSANLNLDKIKDEISLRKKDFETDSSLRMVNLKEKLNDILDKVRDNPIIDKDRRNRIVGRINKAIKFDQKKELAESILKGFNKKIEKISELSLDRLENVSSEDKQNESNELLFCESGKNEDNIQNDNMLLTDMSDLSFIDKLK